MHCGIIADEPKDIQTVIECPCSPGELKELAAKATRIEVWHTSFEDPGPDWNEYRVYAGDKLLGTLKTNGY